jgi:4-amino-4-deoxy-L-arabinose transferase-like glycosyltransferase
MRVSKEALGLLILFVSVSILQFAFAQRHSLWADEFFSLAMATGHSLEHRATDAQPQLGDFVEPQGPVPAAEFRRYLQHESPPATPARVIRAVLLSDTSPPLYYLLLEGWTLIFGTSDLALRLFSVSFSIASLPPLAALARRIAGPRAAIASCVLFAFSPLVVYYATEGRMYSLLIFLALTTSLASLLLQERGPQVGYCLLWVALSAAGFLTHYFFVFPWLANAAFLLLQPGKFQRRWLLLCGMATGLIILPWVWVAAGALSSWKVTQGWLNWIPIGFHRMRALAAQFTQFFSAEGDGLWRTPSWSALCSLALFGLAVALAPAGYLRRQLFTGPCLFLWLWLIAGSTGPIAIHLLQHTYTAAFPRYAITGVPTACLLGGIVLSSVGPRLVLAFLGLIVVAWLPGLHNIYRQGSRYGEPVREIVQIISATARASDLVLVHSIPSGVLGVARYARTSAAFGSWVGQLGNRHVPKSLQTMAHGRSRILLVELHEVGAPAPEEDWLRANAAMVDQKRIQSIDLIDFRPKPNAAF